MFFNSVGQAQHTRKSDSVYIKFIEKWDKIDNSKSVFKTTAFHILDPDYEQKIERYRKAVQKLNEKPYLSYPRKPSKYFSYYQIKKTKHKKNCYLYRIEFYNRQRLEDLDPNQQKIFIVKVKKDSIALFEVSFYDLEYE